MTTTPAEIMRACQHDGPRDAELRIDGEIIRACWRCGNAAGDARRAARQVELASRPNDCARCGLRPHTWTVGPWRLCGRCKTATMREHYGKSARLGVLAMVATVPLVDTSTWAMRQESQGATT